MRRALVLAVLSISCAAAAVLTLPMRRTLTHGGDWRGREAHSARLSLGGGTLAAVYTVELVVGKHQQLVTVLVDSGSSLFGVVATGCKMVNDGSSCAGTLFDPTVSSTLVRCSELPSCAACGGDGACSASIAYLDKTAASGLVYTDVVKLDEENSTKVFFAAVTRTAGHFSTSLFSGVLGLSYADQHNRVPDFLSSLEVSGVPPIFALCLEDEGGHISFGGVDASRMVDPSGIEWADVYQPHTSWRVSGHSIGVGGAPDPVSISGSNVVVDSGTTLMVVPEAVRSQIQRQLRLLCNSGSPGVREFLCGQDNIFSVPDNRCLPFSLSVFDDLPNVTVVLRSSPSEGASLISIDVSPRSYVRFVEEGSSACGIMAIVSMRDAGDFVILGDVFLRSRFTVFDRVNHRVGFALPRCDLRKKTDPASAVVIGVVVLVAVVASLSAFGIAWCVQRRAPASPANTGAVVLGGSGVRHRPLEELSVDV